MYGCIKNVENGSQIFLLLGNMTTFAEFLKRAVDVAEIMKKLGREPKGAFEVYTIEEMQKKYVR